MKRNLIAGIIVVVLIGGAVAAGLMSKKDTGEATENGDATTNNGTKESPPAFDGWDIPESIKWEAENPDATDGPIEIVSEAQASGGKALTIPEGPNKTELNPMYKTPEGKPIPKVDWPKYKGKKIPNGVATYSFTVKEEGDYFLWARHYWAHSCANSFDFKIDDGEVEQFSGDSTDKSWIWALPNKTMGKIHLTKGVHKFVLMNREDGMKVDKFLLTTEDEFVPTGKDGD